MVLLANGQFIKSAGVEKYQLASMDGNSNRKKVSLYNVYHVSSLSTNLISVSKITDKGYKVVFDRFKCRVMKGEKVCLTGKREGGVYYLMKHTKQIDVVDKSNCKSRCKFRNI